MSTFRSRRSTMSVLKRGMPQNPKDPPLIPPTLHHISYDERRARPRVTAHQTSLDTVPPRRGPISNGTPVLLGSSRKPKIPHRCPPRGSYSQTMDVPAQRSKPVRVPRTCEERITTTVAYRIVSVGSLSAAQQIV